MLRVLMQLRRAKTMTAAIEPAVEQLADPRVERLERRVAQMETATKPLHDRVSEQPSNAEWSKAVGARQQAGVIERAEQAKREREAADLQAVRDAPLQRARDRALADLVQQQRQLEAQRDHLATEITQIIVEQITLKARPLR